MNGNRSIDSLSARAAQLGIALDEFRNPDGSLQETELYWRIRMVQRYSHEFRFGLLFFICVLAFVLCGVAAWVALH